MSAEATEMSFCFSIVVRVKNTHDLRHCCGTVEAVNKYEALGKAMRIAERLYPVGHYVGHHTVVGEIKLVDPDDPDLCCVDVNT